MHIAQSRHGAATVLRPGSSLTSETASVFSDCFGQATATASGRIILDCGMMTVLDSAGLEALVDAADALAGSRMNLKLFGVNDTIREILELTEVARYFEFYADAGSAIRSYM